MLKAYIIDLIKKYGYLIRLILIIYILIALPFLIAQFLTSKHAYNEIRRQNSKYYYESVEYFSNYYKNQFQKIVENSLLISIEKNLAFSTAFSNAWNKIDAIQSLKIYDDMLHTVEEIALYYYDSEAILTSKHAYTLQQYLELFAPDNEQLKNDFIDTLKTGDSFNYKIISSFGNASYQNSKLIISKQMNSGIFYENKAVLFYILSSDFIPSESIGFINSEKCGLSIFDGSKIIYHNSYFDHDLCRDAAFLTFLNSKDILFNYKSDNVNNSVFKVYNANLNLTFIAVIPDNIVIQNMNQYNKSITNNLLILTFAIIFVCAISIYLSYKPISSIIRNIICDTNSRYVGNEINTIEHTIKTIKKENYAMLETVVEQRLILMEHILESILNGFSNSKDYTHLLNKNLINKHFLSIIIYDLTLDNANREIFAQKTSDSFGSPVFITDIPYEKYMVIIAVVEPDINTQLLNIKLKQLLKISYNRDFIIGIGSIVDNLDKLRSSYLNAIINLKVNHKMLNTLQLEDVNVQASYFDNLVAQFLQCVQNGFTDDAQKKLREIFEQLAGITDYINRNYSCYVLLVSFIQSVKELSLDIDSHMYYDLIHFDCPDALYKKLNESVISVCSAVTQKLENAVNPIKKQIIDYVDEHFCDYDIFLIQVSDHFNISVYTCSRIFKEITGIGFKEYIAAKRMNLSKELLLTTSKNIYEIANAVGFNTSAYFATWFKANYGVSPTKFRQIRYN